MENKMETALHTVRKEYGMYPSSCKLAPNNWVLRASGNNTIAILILGRV